MPAEQPTILATSGGLRRSSRIDFEFAPLLTHAVDLAGVVGRKPRLCQIGTALGDQRSFNANFSEAGEAAGVEVRHLNLFPMPPTADLRDYVLSCDVVWVCGGSVANLLAVWRTHELDVVLREAWQSGVVLTGVSAGSLCWHQGGPTDSFGPDLRVITNGLGFLPYGNGVHFDSEEQRRPTVLRAVAEGVLPDTYCTDDGTGVLYRGTEPVEFLSERPKAGVYLVQREGEDKSVEHALDVRRL
ncbi:peptidase E [Crossiella equi]|uniref:Peptidase E n=1 Tax=Crossiella equi TaxID=130796 RepID=A0ABS5ABV7_9PSEU|nr:peptidase E [Crossiella equi]MBP2474060.1 peptidase E [Crossiella equi]